MQTTKEEPSIFDIPKTLQENKLNITVWFQGNANGADIWSVSKSGGEEDRLYLEAENPGEIVPPTFFALKDSGYAIKAHGAFYKGKGIPKKYLSIKPKPEKYLVFRYDSIWLFKP